MAQAQIVNIPDANFKYTLLEADAFNSIAGTTTNNSVVIDTNGDGEIQLSEAAAITVLNVAMPLFQIGSLQGIQSFVNLRELRCGQQLFTNLDLSGMTQLQHVECTGLAINALETVNVSNCTALTQLIVDENSIVSINLNGCTALHSLSMNNNHFNGTIDFSAAINLQQLIFSGSGGSGSVIASGLTQLQTLSVEVVDGINSIDLSNNPGLTSFSVNSGPSGMGSLNLSGCAALTSVAVMGTALQSLNLDGIANLTNIALGGTQITSLDLSNFPNLEYLSLIDNPITALDLSQNPLLLNVDVAYCPVTVLDLSQQTVLTNLYAAGSALQTLNLKNGHTEIVSVQGVNTLQFICADEGDFPYIQTILSQAGLSGVNVNTYCSFEPGGNHNTISGIIRYDLDANGCTASDLPYAFATINVSDGTYQGSTASGQDGSYNLYVATGSHILTPQITNPSYFTITPATATVNFANANNNTAIQDFCISANGVHPDLEVVLMPLTVARPGFDATYKLTVRNVGNQALSGSFSLTFDDAVLDLVSTNPSAVLQNTGYLVWNYSNLMPFQSQIVQVIFNVNSPMETPPVNIDDVLSFTLEAQVTADETPSNNIFTLNQTVVGSLDPNDKTCLEGDAVNPTQIGDYLHYLIRFENTGTYPAENVVVKDFIDPNMFDIATLVVTDASHPMVSRTQNNHVEFIFENINLPFDHASNDGYVAFKIKTKNTLAVGDSVANTADIFFDYNFPITTNTATSTFEVLGVKQQTAVGLALYPNPAQDKLYLSDHTAMQTASVLDTNGRVLQTQMVQGKTATLTVSDLASGIYFVQVRTQAGVATLKFVKR